MHLHRISCVSGIVFLLAFGMLFFSIEEARANTTDNVVSGAPQLPANVPNSRGGSSPPALGTPVGTPQSVSPRSVSANVAPTLTAPTPPPPVVAASPVEGVSEPAGRLVGEVAEPAGGVLGGVAELAGETVAPVADGAGNAVETAAAPVAPSASEPALGATGGTVGGVVEPVARTTTPIFEPVAEEIVSPAVRTVDELASSAVGPVAEGANPIVEPVGETVGRTATPLVEPVSDAAKPLAAPVADVASPVVESVAGVVESVVEPTRPITGAVPSPEGHDERPIAIGEPSAKPAMDSPSTAPPETVNAEHFPAGGVPDGRPSARPVEAAFAENVSADAAPVRDGESGAAHAESRSEPTKTAVDKFESPVSERTGDGETLSSGSAFVPVFDGVDVVSSSGGDIGARGTAASSGGFAGGFSSPLPAVPSGGVSSASSSGSALELGVLGSLSLAWFGGKLLRRDLRRFHYKFLTNLVFERPG